MHLIERWFYFYYGLDHLRFASARALCRKPGPRQRDAWTPMGATNFDFFLICQRLRWALKPAHIHQTFPGQSSRLTWTKPSPDSEAISRRPRLRRILRPPQVDKKSARHSGRLTGPRASGAGVWGTIVPLGESAEAPPEESTESKPTSNHAPQKYCSNNRKS